MDSSYKPLRIGVMGCSSFAIRNMVPAIIQSTHTELVAIASRDVAKARLAAETFGCSAVEGYEALLGIPEIDAIYMPLPTGLHENWVPRVIAAGKHLLVEKSLATSFKSSEKMINAARARGLLILENFLFPRHSQYEWVRQALSSGTIGECRIIRAAFTIPPLDPTNFRYIAELGGGALLDLGAYMVKTALCFLGPQLELLSATMEHDIIRNVDLRGTATFRSTKGVIAQTAWGFDMGYQCSWEFIGSKGQIRCNRALTPPPDLSPSVRIESPSCYEDINLPPDNHYVNQLQYFASHLDCLKSITKELDECLLQARLLHSVKHFALNCPEIPCL